MPVKPISKRQLRVIGAIVACDSQVSNDPESLDDIDHVYWDSVRSSDMDDVTVIALCDLGLVIKSGSNENATVTLSQSGFEVWQSSNRIASVPRIRDPP